MQMSLLKLVIVFSLLILLQMCVKKKDEPVAVVGGKIITLQEFKDDFKREKAIDILKSATDSMKLAHLNKMIDRELLIIDAYRKQIDKDRFISAQFDNLLKNSVFKKLWLSEIIRAIVPESEIRDTYQKQKKQIRVSDIVLKFVKNDSTDTENEIKEMIDEVYSQLKDGAKFDSLAKRYSHDKTSGPKGGDKGFLEWNVSVMDDDFFKKAITLEEGEYSKPFKVKNEYHLIKVVEVKKIKLDKYENERKKIVKQLTIKRRRQILKQKKEVIDKYIKKYNGAINKENVTFMVENINKIDSVKDSKRNLQRSRRDIFANLSDGDTSRVLYRFASDQTITIGRLVASLKPIDPGRRPPLKTEEELRTLIESVLMYDIIAYEGFQRKYDKDETILKELNNLREKGMLEIYLKKEIFDLVNVEESAITKHYENNKMKYTSHELREVEVIWMTQADDANKALAEINAGRAFNRIARKYNFKRGASKETDGYIGWIKREEFGPIGIHAFKMKKGETSDLIKIGENFSIVHLLDIKPPEPKTLEQVKKRIKNELHRKFCLEKEKEILRRIRKEVKIVIFENKAVSILNDEQDS